LKVCKRIQDFQSNSIPTASPVTSIFSRQYKQIILDSFDEAPWLARVSTLASLPEPTLPLIQEIFSAPSHTGTDSILSLRQRYPHSATPAVHNWQIINHTRCSFLQSGVSILDDDHPKALALIHDTLRALRSHGMALCCCLNRRLFDSETNSGRSVREHENGIIDASHSVSPFDQDTNSDRFFPLESTLSFKPTFPSWSHGMSYSTFNERSRLSRVSDLSKIVLNLPTTTRGHIQCT
jgi:hypothetical protein